MRRLSVSKLFLGLILLASFFLYTYKLSTLPPGLTWDEAALGYNAYSILKTARDEHGAFLPLIFKSFGDYKPGLYVYLTLPFVALGGLTELATRLPSALFGSLAVLGIYLFTNLLFDSTQNKPLFKFINPGHLTALTLALSPWHLHFSHAAWEANLALTLTLFGLYFWLKFLKQSRFSLWPAVLLALLSLLSYQSAKLITPASYLIVLIASRQNPLNLFKKVQSLRFDLILTAVLTLLVGWIYLVSFLGPAGNRLARLSIFNYRPQLSSEQLELSFNNLSLAHFLYSNTDLSLRSVGSRYLYHFSPSVLFYPSPPLISREHIPRVALMHLFDVVLLVLGLIFIARQKNSLVNTIILGLLLLGPLPAALTLSEYSPVRALFMVIPLSLLTGAGIYYLFKNFSYFISLPIVLIWLFYLALNLNLYYKHASDDLAQDYNYGYKQAIEQIKEHPGDKVVMTDVLGQPYIYYLFYTRFDPAVYQSKNDYIDSGGVDVGKVGRVGSVEFHQFAASEIVHFKNTLFIGQVGNLPDDYDITASHIDYYHTISDPFGKVIFKVLKTK